MAVDRRPPRPLATGDAPRCRGRRKVSLHPWLGGACVAAAVAVASLASPGQALALLAAATLLLALGRESAAPAGLLLGAAPLQLAACLVLLDVGVLLLLTPRLAGPQPPHLVAATARRRNGSRRPRKVLGLFGRALVPFAFQAPLVTTLMGEAARLPARRLLAAVAAASAVGGLAWTFGFALAALWLGSAALVAGLVVAVPLALLGIAMALVSAWGIPGRARVA